MANLLGSIGAAQPVTQFIDTALKYQTRQDASLLAQQEAALRAQETQNLKVREQAMQQQLTEAQKQQEELHRLRPFESSVLYQLTPEEERPKLLEIAKAGGYLDEGGRMSMFQRNKMMEESKQFAPFFLDVQLRKEQANVDKAISALDKATESGDPAAIKKAESALRFRLARIELLKGANDKVANILGAGKKTEELEKVVGPDGTPVLVPRSEAAGKQPYEKPNEMPEIRREQIAETERHNRELERLAAEKNKAGGQNLGFADKEAIRAMGKQLPKSKLAAETAVKNVQKIERMIDLINRGAGGVRGELLSKINKVTDVLRSTSPEDAKYNQLKSELRGFAGQLRLQLGLVGQTSDRDVAIMYEAAGGGTPAESQKASFEGYKQAYLQDINNYNSDAKAYSGYSEAGGNLYKPMEIPNQGVAVPPTGITVVEERTLPNGQVWQKLSDGTFKQVK